MKYTKIEPVSYDMVVTVKYVAEGYAETCQFCFNAIAPGHEVMMRWDCDSLNFTHTYHYNEYDE